jgi:hypothetical protein
MAESTIGVVDYHKNSFLAVVSYGTEDEEGLECQAVAPTCYTDYGCSWDVEVLESYNCILDLDREIYPGEIKPRHTVACIYTQEFFWRDAGICTCHF